MQLLWVDKVTARTTMRLWHDLHVASAQPHTFDDMFEPTATESLFVGGVVGDEIRAIAQCTSVNPDPRRAKLRRIAHAPHYEASANALVRLLAQGVAVGEALKVVRMAETLQAVGLEPSLRTRQPRWHVAYHFHAAEACNTTDASSDPDPSESST